jgi:hypothetical protein
MGASAVGGVMEGYKLLLRKVLWKMGMLCYMRCYGRLEAYVVGDVMEHYVLLSQEVLRMTGSFCYRGS